MGVFNVGDWLYPDISQGRQPQDVVGLNKSNQLACSITHMLPLGGDLRDLVSGKLISLASTGSVASDSRGRSLRGNGSQAVGTVSLNLSASFYTTISFWLYWDSFANDDKLAGELSTNTSSFDGAFLLDPNAAVGRWQFYTRITSTVSGHAVSFTRPSAGAWHHYMIRVERSAGVSTSAAVAIWVDGLPQSLTLDTNVTPGSTTNFANSTFYFFSRASTSLFGAGRMQNLTFRLGDLDAFNRAAAIAKAEFNDPWQVFENPPINIWAPSAGGTTSATISGTDDPDTVAVVAATWTTAQIATTDGGDVAALATIVTTGAGIAGTDGADNAVIAAANWTTAQVSGADGADVSAITASANNQTSASIGATDGGDSASIYAANWTTALLAAVDGADAAVLVAGTAGTISAGISATDAADIVSIGVAGATGPLILAGSMRHAASLSSSARLATTLRGSIAHV